MDVYLKDFARSPVFGHRIVARPIRDKINSCLNEQTRVVINFRDVEATQSFTDELVGALILQHGPDVIGRLVFAECSESMKGILKFVIRDRVQQRLDFAATQKNASFPMARDGVGGFPAHAT